MANKFYQFFIFTRLNWNHELLYKFVYIATSKCNDSIEFEVVFHTCVHTVCWTMLTAIVPVYQCTEFYVESVLNFVLDGWSASPVVQNMSNNLYTKGWMSWSALLGIWVIFNCGIHLSSS